MKSEALIKCVELQLGRKAVKMEDRFIEDLGAESIDIVFILATVESDTGLHIPEEVIPDLETVKDLFNYIHTHQR
jgi:acyl carrier protein